MRCAMSAERLTTGPAEPGHPDEPRFALALRIALIAGAATAAYLVLALFDGPAYAEDSPVQPGPLGGVIDVVAAVPRSLADSGPSAGDRTEDASDAPQVPDAVVDAPQPPDAVVDPPQPPDAVVDPPQLSDDPAAPPADATTTPARLPTVGDVRGPGLTRTGLPGSTDAGEAGPGCGSGGHGEAGPARGADGRGAPGGPGRTKDPKDAKDPKDPKEPKDVKDPKDPKDADLGVVESGESGDADTGEETPEAPGGGLPLPAAETDPILVVLPAAVADLLDVLVDVGLPATEALIPRAPSAPTTPPQPGMFTLSLPAGPPPAAPAPLAHGLAGSVTVAPAGSSQLQAALPVTSPWRDDPVLVSTSRLGDAVYSGRSPAVPALPG